MKGQVVCFESLAGREAGVEPTGASPDRKSSELSQPGERPNREVWAGLSCAAGLHSKKVFTAFFEADHLSRLE